MRSSVAVLTTLTVILVGVVAISTQANQVDPPADSTANESYTVAVETYGSVLSTGGPGIVWFGVTAVILIAAGYLVAVASRGDR